MGMELVLKLFTTVIDSVTPTRKATPLPRDEDRNMEKSRRWKKRAALRAALA